MCTCLLCPHQPSSLSPLSTTDLVGPHVANPLYWEQHAAESCGTGKWSGKWLGGWVGRVWMPSFPITHLSSFSSNGLMQHCVNSPNLPEGSLEYALKELPLHPEGQPSGSGRGLVALYCCATVLCTPESRLYVALLKVVLSVVLQS